MRWLLVGSCMRAGYQRDQAMLRSVGLSVPHLILWGEERGWKMS